MPATYYIPLYLQSAKQRSPVMSGVLLIPPMIATVLTGVGSGMVIHKTGRHRELIWVGATTPKAGTGSFISLRVDSSMQQFIDLTILFGLGAGMLYEAPDVATATSTLDFVRGLFMAISLIVGGTVLQNSMDRQSKRLMNAIGLPLTIAQEFCW